MKKYFSILPFLMLCFATKFANAAAIDPSTLTKVTTENDPKCVEYFSYKGEMYCSTTPQLSEPVDPHLKDKESQKIVFDDRVWQAVWGKETPLMTTIEYVPAGDDINKWHELITSDKVQGLPPSVTPKQYADVIIDGLKKSGFPPVVNFFEESPDKVIFEYRIEAPANLKEDVLTVIQKKNDTIYLLLYDIKKADMGEKNREKWLKNLKAAEIK